MLKTISPCYILLYFPMNNFCPCKIYHKRGILSYFKVIFNVYIKLKHGKKIKWANNKMQHLIGKAKYSRFEICLVCQEIIFRYFIDFALPNQILIWFFFKNRFYNRETIRDIRISRLAFIIVWNHWTKKKIGYSSSMEGKGV